MKMLVHVCCGPCACGTLPFWQAKGVEAVGFFYNPNIHPFLEFRRRLEGMNDVAASTCASVVVDDSYDPMAWFEAVSGGTTDSRCERCIGMRLERTAREAIAQGCDAFSTTLSISPWQDHQAIQTSGSSAGDKHGIEFVYEDLRSEYPLSQRVSRELGVYRQKYCGCVMSEWERYRKKAPVSGSPRE